jgi:hypothetical protein
MSNTYNYGIIQGGTGSFGSIQYTSDGVGGTKEIMATGSAGPKFHNLMSVSASAALEAGASTLGSLKVSDLTSGRVVFAGANGELQDDSDMTFSGDTLTVTKLGAYEQAGAVDFSDEAMTNVNIDSGAIDNTRIGASTPQAGTFTQLTANTSADINGFADISSTLYVGGAASFAGAVSMTGTLNAKGDVDLGDATSDTITATGRFDSNLVPSADATQDLGTTSFGWNDLHLGSGGVVNFDGGDVTLTHAAGKVTFGGDGAVEIDFNSHEMTNVDIDSGAIDGTRIGAANPQAGTFLGIKGTTLSGSNTLDVDGVAQFNSNVTVKSSAQLISDNVNVGGGEIDGTPVGGNVASTGKFTTLTSTGNSSVSGSLHVLGNIDVEGNINSVTKTVQTLEVEDKVIIVASGSNASDTSGAGLQFGGHESTGANASILFDNDNTSLDFNIGTTTEIRLEAAKLLPQVTNDVDLGSSTLQYKDLYIDGKAYIDQLGEHLDANSKNITGVQNFSGSDAVQAGASTLGSLKVSDLTATRIVFAGANGELQDDSDLTFATDTLTATKIGAFEAAGAINFADQNMTNVDIDSGAIDNTRIGASTPQAGTFTQLTANTSADINGFADISSTLYVGGAASFAGALSVTGTINAKGDVDLGSDSSDTVSVNGLIDTNLIPTGDDARDLGSSTNEWKDLYVDGIAYVDQLGTPGDKISAVYATNVYTGDFHMKNERGDWTLFEESDYLRIRNNKTGQEFKMDMTPISED